MKRQCDLLVTADILLTQNSQREIVEQGAVAVKGGHIAAVGSTADILDNWASDNRHDLGNSLLMPGLVNAHTHAPMSYLRGVTDDLPLMEWLNEHIFPIEQKINDDIVRVGAMLSHAEMIRTGTTCICDMYSFSKVNAKAMHDSGIRALTGEATFGFPTLTCPTPEQAFVFVEELIEEYEGHPRITPMVTMHGVYTTDADLLKRSWRFAETHGLSWAIHLAETKQETQQCMDMFGKRPVAYLESLGCLAEETILAHCVDLTDEEIRHLSRRGANIVHNPESNMKLASGIAPVDRQLAAGINVALGTDGAASNNNQNMFTEMTSAALLQKVGNMDSTSLPAQKVLDMGTLNGAKALNVKCGSLEPGKCADMIALDLTQPNLLPLFNPVSQVTYAANGGEVTMTMIDGEILYKDGQYTRINYSDLMNEVEDMKQWVLKQRV